MAQTGFQFDAEGAWIAKDANASKDYKIDWSKWLQDGDIIESVVWDIPPGLVNENEGKTATVAFIELSGGTIGANYIITAHIVTVAGLEDDKSFRLVIKES